jgi:hypothetical protein
MQINASIRGWLKNSTRWWDDLSDKFVSTVGFPSKVPAALFACLHLTLAYILVVVIQSCLDEPFRTIKTKVDGEKGMVKYMISSEDISNSH